MAFRSLPMQHNMNMQQQLNLTLYTTPFYFDNASQLSDLDSYESSVEGADNYTDLYCPSFSPYANKSYLNVSCDTPLEFSVPLYGETRASVDRVTLIDLFISRHHRTILHSHHTHRQLSNRYRAVKEEYANAYKCSIIRLVNEFRKINFSQLFH